MRKEIELSLDELATLVRMEKQFSYQGKQFILREPDGEAVRLWRAGLIRNRTLNDNGRPTTVEGTEKSDAELISYCFREIVEAPDGKRSEKPWTPDEILRFFVHKAVDRMWEWVSMAAGFSEDETVESLNVQIEGLTQQRDELARRGSAAKNGQFATTASSA